MSPSTHATTPASNNPAFALLRAVEVSIPDWEYRYVGIADHIRACIHVTPSTYGYRLPRHPEMADFYGVCAATISHAMKHLSATGTVRVLTKGTYIITGQKLPNLDPLYDRIDALASASPSRPHLVTGPTG